MSFQAYRASPFEFTHENKVFNQLYDLLQTAWEGREEPLHLIGNVYVAGRPVDALVIKSHAVIVIDFKDYGGDVTFSENGSWYANDVIVKGGGSTNPYQQIRNNKFTLLNYLQENVVFQSEPQLGHIAGLCLFHQDIHFDDKQIPTGINRWFHVSDMSHVVRIIDAITSNAIDLSGTDIDKIITSLDIPSFNPDGNAPIITTITQSSTDTEKRVHLTPIQQRAIDSATSWLAGDQNSVLSITGAENSGKKTILKIIKNLLSEQGKSPLFLSPNARIANKYKGLGFSDVQSIYSWLYASRPSRFEKDKACYDVSLTIPDATREVLIFLDAHLLGDDKFETETTRYGTGYLLQDMLTALTENNEALPKMLLVGDPFQLTRGSIQRSLLIGEVFKDKNIMFSTCELNEQVSSGDLSRFQLPLISALSNNTFNCLPDVEGQQVEEVIVGEHTDEIGHALVAWPKRTVFLCAKNVDVYKVNRGIRRKFLMTQDMSVLIVGDIVDVHNRTAGINDGFTDSTWVNSGTFGQVVHVDPEIETKSILLKGRKAGTVLHFATATIHFEGVGNVRVRYIPEYLSSETPDLTPDQLVALNIFAREEATEKLKDQKRILDEAKNHLPVQEYRLKQEEYQKQLAYLIMNSSYFNAARLRFAYALTVHRAQGYIGWEQVYVDASCCHDNANYSSDSYFRWLYTVTCCSTENIGLLNYPTLNPISNASWQLSPKKISPIIVKPRFYFDSEQSASDKLPVGFDVSNKLFSKIYLTISRLLKGSEWYIRDVIQGRPYQQVYELEKNDGSSATVQFSFNKKDEVTIQSVRLKPESVDYQTVVSMLSTQPSYQHEAIESAANELIRHLNSKGWNTVLVEEKTQYKAFLTFVGVNGQIKLDLNVGGKGLVSSIKVEQVDSEIVLNEFREGLNYVN